MALDVIRCHQMSYEDRKEREQKKKELDVGWHLYRPHRYTCDDCLIHSFIFFI